MNVASWSPRVEFRPASNQYESHSIVLLQTGTGHFMQAKNGGGNGMGADGTQNGPWERLRMFECQTVVINMGLTRHIVAFQTQNGEYVGAVGGGGSHVIAEASVIGPWELFYLGVLPGGFGKVTIRCSDEVHFWTAPGGVAARLRRTSPRPRSGRPSCWRPSRSERAARLPSTLTIQPLAMAGAGER